MLEMLSVSMPKKPRRPRRPKKSVTKMKDVWSSDDDDCTLASLLHLIPEAVHATDIKICSIDTSMGQKTIMSYAYEIPNTRYDEQLKKYNERMVNFMRDLMRWKENVCEWETQREACLDSIREYQRLLRVEMERGLECLETA